jgi:hypothetical protein
LHIAASSVDFLGFSLDPSAMNIFWNIEEFELSHYNIVDTPSMTPALSAETEETPTPSGPPGSDGATSTPTSSGTPGT